VANLPSPVDPPLLVSLVLFLAQWPIGLASLAAWYITRRLGAVGHLDTDSSMSRMTVCVSGRN